MLFIVAKLLLSTHETNWARVSQNLFKNLTVGNEGKNIRWIDGGSFADHILDCLFADVGKWNNGK